MCRLLLWQLLLLCRARQSLLCRAYKGFLLAAAKLCAQDLDRARCALNTSTRLLCTGFATMLSWSERRQPCIKHLGTYSLRCLDWLKTGVYTPFADLIGWVPLKIEGRPKVTSGSKVIIPEEHRGGGQVKINTGEVHTNKGTYVFIIRTSLMRCVHNVLASIHFPVNQL